MRFEKEGSHKNSSHEELDMFAKAFCDCKYSFMRMSPRLVVIEEALHLLLHGHRPLTVFAGMPVSFRHFEEMGQAFEGQ